MRSLAILFAAGALAVAADKPKAPAARKGPPRPGVKAVQQPISNIQPDAVFPVEGTPDWLAITPDSVWVSNKPRNTVHRLDLKTNKVTATVDAGKKPCSGLAYGFGSIWAPLCEDEALARIDIATNKVVAKIPAGPADTEGGLTTSPDSVWMLSKPSGSLLRIDPATNKIVAEIMVPSGSVACTYGDGAIWVTSVEKSVVTRVDPKTNLIAATIETGPSPRFLTFGENSVWTLNQGDGSVSRIDAKTNKLTATIELGVPGKGGEIAFGEGAVWVTVFEIPLSRIDPATNKVTKQWVGPGGDSVRAGQGAVWLTNIREQNIWRISPSRL